LRDHARRNARSPIKRRRILEFLQRLFRERLARHSLAQSEGNQPQREQTTEKASLGERKTDHHRRAAQVRWTILVTQAKSRSPEGLGSVGPRTTTTTRTIHRLTIPEHFRGVWP